MPEIFWVLSGSDFSLDLNNPDDKKFLCVGNNPALSQTYAPVIALIISASLKQMNQQGKAKSVVILDEAPTIFIPNFAQIPATARSNRVATFYCAQDISQIVDSYGETPSETIISNLGNQFYGRTTNPKTAKRVSELFGKDDMEFSSRSVSKGKQVTHGHSTSFQLRDRLKPQEMMGLSAGTFVGIIAEGNQTEFYTKFDALPAKEKAITAFHSVSQTEILANFNRINEEAINCLS
jgi:type IV secretory pathway TraG/TraD family ATPase VirD4